MHTSYNLNCQKYYLCEIKMSIQLPELTLTNKQIFTNSDGSHTEFKVHNNILYVTRVVNGQTEGGILVLDALPPSATLGMYGTVTSSSVIEGEYTLAVDSDDYTEDEMADLAVALQAELEAQFPGK